MTSTQSGFASHPGSLAESNERSRQIDFVFWALLLILVGVAMLAQVPWGWFLVALGVLVIGAQTARWQMNLKVDGFWVACGAVFIAGGVWSFWRSRGPSRPYC